MRARIMMMLAGMLFASACFAEEAALPTVEGFVQRINADGGLALLVRTGSEAMKDMQGKEIVCYLEDGAKVKPLKGDRLKAGLKFVEEGKRYVLVNIEILPPGDPLAYRIIKDDRTVSIGAEAAVVVETYAQLEKLWELLYEDAPEKPPLPEIDFDTRVLLAMFMGPQAGKESRLVIIDIAETAESVNVYLRYVEKGEADKPSTPYLLATMDRRPAPVVFVDETPRPNSDYYVDVEKIAEGDKSSWDTEGTLLIENQEQLQAAWDKIYEYKKVKPELPKVDFDRETVALAGWGVKKVDGYSVSVEKVYQRDNAVHVLVLKHIPTHSGGRGHFQPFVMAKFPKPQVPIVIDYEMEMVGEPLAGVNCNVDKPGVVTATTPEAAAEAAKSYGLDEEATKKLTVVNYDYNMAALVFTGNIMTSVKLKIDRVYRTNKEIVVEISLERAGMDEKLGVMQASMFITEKSDLPITLRTTRLAKQAFPLKPAPQQ